MNVILAVVDIGIVGYLRLSEEDFGGKILAEKRARNDSGRRDGQKTEVTAIGGNE
jgi:hypothetical protein